MQTSTRHRDAAHGASFAARTKGHAPHLSISDDSHHVTETIGFMYGDGDERDPRRASHAPSLARSSYYSQHSNDDDDLISPRSASFPRRTPVENKMNAPSPPSRTFEPSNGQIAPHPVRSYSFENANGQPQSSSMAAREPSAQDVAQSQFPLNDLDYESSPAAVAKELSNLQALRRMSMDVHAAGDPDLPSLNPAAIPNSPSPTASDDDESRLFWVPARLHPELAPKEFKTFLDSKAEQIKRRSGDLSLLGSSSVSSRSGSFSSNSSGLARKKSMLSKEINSPVGYQDGADILGRRRSSPHARQGSDPNLAELESLVANNLHVQRPESPDENGDFILPSIPSSSLKRSTKTKYQRTPGGPRGRGDRAQRGGKRTETPDQETNYSTVSPVPEVPPQFNFTSANSNNLADTLSYPAPKAGQIAQNFSRPVGRSPSPPQEPITSKITSNTFDSILESSNVDRSKTQTVPDTRPFRKQITRPDRKPTPQIVETPPVEDVPPQTVHAEVTQNPDELSSQNALQQQRHPARTSSREGPKPVTRPPMPRTYSSTSGKPARTDIPPITNPKQSLEQPSPLPGNDTNTSNLSFIPTLTVDKHSQEKKETKKSGWNWLRGKDDDKDKGKGKPGKGLQNHDGTRLDLLQTSIDGSSRRRETIEIDRDSMRLDEERKKESQRKAPSNDKKEKDGIFSSIFGGKKKAEKEAKKTASRLSPEPPNRELKPDIDYSWTRFSILEERAIYRMAHIKLANPRRPLYSQVLLSNFMYSYLAKVQQMHPQMNLPTNAKQQKKQKEEPKQSDEFSVYQRYQQQEQQQQQQQPPAAPQSPQQQQHPQQPVAHEGQHSSNGYEQSNSRPSTRGSTRNTEGANNTGQYTNHSSHSHRTQKQPAQQYEKDRESEMW